MTRIKRKRAEAEQWCFRLHQTTHDQNKELPRVPPQFDGMKPGELLGDLPGELLDFGGQLFLAAEVTDLQVQTSQSRLLRYIVELFAGSEAPAAALALDHGKGAVPDGAILIGLLHSNRFSGADVGAGCTADTNRRCFVKRSTDTFFRTPQHG